MSTYLCRDTRSRSCNAFEPLKSRSGSYTIAVSIYPRWARLDLPIKRRRREVYQSSSAPCPVHMAAVSTTARAQPGPRGDPRHRSAAVTDLRFPPLSQILCPSFFPSSCADELTRVCAGPSQSARIDYGRTCLGARARCSPSSQAFLSMCLCPEAARVLRSRSTTQSITHGLKSAKGPITRVCAPLAAHPQRELPPAHGPAVNASSNSNLEEQDADDRRLRVNSCEPAPAVLREPQGAPAGTVQGADSAGRWDACPTSLFAAFDVGN